MTFLRYQTLLKKNGNVENSSGLVRWRHENITSQSRDEHLVIFIKGTPSEIEGGQPTYRVCVAVNRLRNLGAIVAHPFGGTLEHRGAIGDWKNAHARQAYDAY